MLPDCAAEPLAVHAASPVGPEGRPGSFKPPGGFAVLVGGGGGGGCVAVGGGCVAVGGGGGGGWVGVAVAVGMGVVTTGGKVIGGWVVLGGAGAFFEDVWVGAVSGGGSSAVGAVVPSTRGAISVVPDCVGVG